MQAEAVADLIDAVTPLQARAAFDQLEGTLTRAIGGDRRGAVRSDRAARGVGRFSRRGLSLRRARRAGAARSTGCSRGRRALLADARPRPAGSRRAAGRDRRQAERRQVEPVQRARRRVARDRHRRARHDARSGDRGRRPRRPARHARRHRRPPRHRRSGRGRRRRARAAGARRSPTWCCWSRIDRVRDRGASVTDEQSSLRRKQDAICRRRGTTIARCAVSATTGAGLDELRRRDRRRRSTSIRCAIARRSPTSGTSRSSSARTTRCSRARDAALADGGSLSEEFVLADLQDARAALEEITGRRAPDDLLAHIFSRFCIGK